MLTVLVLFCGLLVLAFIVAVITGVVAVSPILLLVIILPVIDYFMFKLLRSLFRRRKKE